ncbi:hypothetical protein HQ590_09580 [bacterium]|nr:hypothetical protein [bacterium]
MATSPKSTGSKANVIVWSILAILVLAAGVLALNVTQRLRRVQQETNQVRNVVQEAIRRQEMIVKAPARKEFSAAFLQMAFGDNPPLLEQIKEALAQALGDNPALAQGDVALMLVTYRAEGELRDVAIHIFGNLIPERLPAFSSEGYWRGQLPPNIWDIGQSSLSLLGREVLVLANKETEQRQREVLDAIFRNRFAVVADYLHDPVSFIAVVPEPSVLLTEQFRPYMAAMLVKGKISMDETRSELVALSYDPKRAQDLAQLLSDMRMVAIGLTRLRFPSQRAEGALQSLTRVQIAAEGPTVIARGHMPGTTLERSLPRLVRVLSKGIQRIHRGPGYPT